MKFVLFSDRHMPHLRFTGAPHGRGEALLLMKGAETKKKTGTGRMPYAGQHIFAEIRAIKNN